MGERYSYKVNRSGIMDHIGRDPVFERDALPLSRLKEYIAGMALIGTVSVALALIAYNKTEHDNGMDHWGERILTIEPGTYEVDEETVNLQGEPHGASKVLGTLKIGDKFFAVAVLGAEYPINPLDRLAPQECGDDRCGIWYERKIEDQKTGEMKKMYVRGDKLVRVE